MRVGERAMRTIWPTADGSAVEVIDQTRLPHELATVRLATVEEAAAAIRDMVVRGAPLIGATAAYGLALALRADPTDTGTATAMELLAATRPTAVNLRWALTRVRNHVMPLVPEQRAAAAFDLAGRICEEDVAICEAIGEHGRALVAAVWERRERTGVVNILTHCNAGWLATIDWGTATAPIYKAHDAGIPVHVWVDETRPRNQGAGLTAWELLNHGVPHTVIVDSAAGHVMQRGLVDLCIVGTDRTTVAGDVANKIGTYSKALAARDTGVPFYVAAPSPSIDWTLRAGTDIPIEERSGDEVALVRGRTPGGEIVTVAVTPEGSAVSNPAFDVTPARLVAGLITERGVCASTEEGLRRLFPDAPVDR